MSEAAVRSVRAMYVAYADDVHAYVARRVGADLADDIVADVFRRAIESHERFDPTRGSERGWLFGIATNVLRRHRRTEVRRLRALARAAGRDTAVGDPLLATVVAIDAERDLDRVLGAIAALSDEDFDLLVLVAWEHLTSHEVAEVLGVPAGTVRSRLHRIRVALDRARSTESNDRRVP